MRFEPGQAREVTLISFGGGRRVYGFRQAVMATSSHARQDPARQHAAMFGPTTGDRVRLAALSCSSRSSATSPPTARRVTFGGGKVIRDGMGQSQVTAPPAPSTR